MMEMRPAREEKRVVVLQSNYLPWKGYFDLIQNADLLVFYDDTQYTKNDWRNRNRIKTPRGLEWITIPCGPHHVHRLVHEVRPVHNRWQRSHWDVICQNYRAAPYFVEFRPFLEDFYLSRSWSTLSELNQYLIQNIAEKFLNITTTVKRSSEFRLTGTKEDRLVDLLNQVGATTYLSGPTGRNFLHVEPFEEAGIKMEWMNYAGYPAYSQLHPPFVHEVSIIDLLFHVGPHAAEFLEKGKVDRPKVEAETISLF